MPDREIKQRISFADLTCLAQKGIDRKSFVSEIGQKNLEYGTLTMCMICICKI